jgi:hypothetical protein
MEETRAASWRAPLLLLAAIGAAVVLWLGVSAAMASGGSSGSGDSSGVGSDSGPSWILPAQDEGAPDEERQRGPGGRDCPEKEGDGGGSDGSGSDTASEAV